jgi:phosphatidylserine/phosphatidylglycerophosphate/cardiolipin synthase-like enzyme
MKIYHLPRLHAKVYVADRRRAILTSGNLTFGGLDANYEYGFCVEHARTVRKVRCDMTEYAGLGARIALGQLVTYSRIAEEVRTTFREQQRAVAKSARQAFEEAFRKASDELIKLRVAEGSLNTIFGRTILYLLDKEGPLSTQALHPLVQETPPDLCDDDVDRVIDGVRFGKKWKHSVRTAQQQLKRNGLITLRDGRWGLSTLGVNEESSLRG